MAFYTKQELQGVAKRATTWRKASMVLSEASRSFSPYKTYDIFLSHAVLDAESVLGLKLDLESRGLSVYVDWIEDPQLDRTQVNRNTAATLRARMRVCRSLFYAASSNAENSRWMPWELGYFDAYRQKVAVVPVVDGYQATFKGLEYLSLYPYLEKEAVDLFVREVPGLAEKRRLREWLYAA